MEIVVRMPAIVATGLTATLGINPVERATATMRKPTMNQGTNSAQPGFVLRAALPVCSALRAQASPNQRQRRSTTGPSISTRTSLTRVPTCIAQRADRQWSPPAPAARHRRSRPASTPYCDQRQLQSRRRATAGRAPPSTPSTAVKAMEAAMSSRSAPITGATAAIAELPQIELPQATRTARRLGRRNSAADARSWRRSRRRPSPAMPTAKPGRAPSTALRAERGAEQYDRNLQQESWR